jgi:hypothetical protein
MVVDVVEITLIGSLKSGIYDVQLISEGLIARAKMVVVDYFWVFEFQLY